MKSEQQQARTASVTTPTDREIHVERVFDAPRDRVFAAFTDPKLIPQWWGPTTIIDQMDVRPGGNWRFVTHNADGRVGRRRCYASPDPWKDHRGRRSLVAGW